MVSIKKLEEFFIEENTEAVKDGAIDLTLEEEDSEEDRQLVWTYKQLPKEIRRFWRRRYWLFSLFDKGILIDYDGWFSVTPEQIAIHIAKRCRSKVVVDAFCGVGGNAIQFAKTCDHVIAIDIDATRLECARHNAKIYGVEDKITFIHDDFLSVAPSIKADVVFMSPPWGGVDYMKDLVFDINNMPVNGTEAFAAASRITNQICYFLPKNVDQEQLRDLAGEGNVCEMESVIQEGHLKAYCFYFGKLVTNNNSK